MLSSASVCARTADHGAVLRRRLAMYLAATKLPAPGMFCGTMVGLPGM